MSLNGMIADKNGGEDFISDDSWKLWLEDSQKVDSVIIGRKAFENIKNLSDYNFNDLKKLNLMVVSANKKLKIEKPFKLASNPYDALEKIEKEGLSQTLLTGGAIINSSFAKLNLIDEVIINIEPVIVGTGISLFNPDVFELKLEFLEMRKPQGKLLQLRYKVLKNT